MKKPYIMTAQDKAELAEIEADAANVRLRRKRFFAKLRQRAHRANAALSRAIPEAPNPSPIKRMKGNDNAG